MAFLHAQIFVSVEYTSPKIKYCPHWVWYIDNTNEDTNYIYWTLSLHETCSKSTKWIIKENKYRYTTDCCSWAMEFDVDNMNKDANYIYCTPLISPNPIDEKNYHVLCTNWKPWCCGRGRFPVPQHITIFRYIRIQTRTLFGWIY